MTSYEEILQGMLDQVPSNVDKREGSIIYDALAPCAFFLAQQYFQLENFFDLVFPDTALGEYLEKAVAAYGITRKPATSAIRRMVTSGEVTLGTRWAINDLVYVVTAQTDLTTYEVTCETVGEVGNQYSGSLVALSNITGISAELTDIVTEGVDEESDEALRERYLIKVRQPATSGNAYHYRQWALEVPGVGNAKVFPLDNGPGTVTVLVLDSNNDVSDLLSATVAEYIESVRPIGATVMVSSPETMSVNISANVVLDGSKTMENIEASFKEVAENFLKSTIFETYRISYAKIASLLLDVPGVADFDGFLLNDGMVNLTVGEKAIPILGTITLTEVSALAAD